MERHVALQLPDLFSVHLQEGYQRHGGERDGGLNTEDFRRAKLCDPFDLDICCHEASPVTAGRDPRTNLARAFRVAVE